MDAVLATAVVGGTHQKAGALKPAESEFGPTFTVSSFERSRNRRHKFSLRSSVKLKVTFHGNFSGQKESAKL
jgi:hypothetical protein